MPISMAVSSVGSTNLKVATGLTKTPAVGGVQPELEYILPTAHSPTTI